MTIERPIVFTGDSVRAILDGRKTQTRRVVKFPLWWGRERMSESSWQHYSQLHTARAMVSDQCPYGKVGDHLWVREAWVMAGTGAVFYRADGELAERNFAWRSPIHMPRSASRLTLEITSLRIERLQDITEADAIAEGITLSDRTGRYMPGNCDNAVWAYREYWDFIHARRNDKRDHAWTANPWVWVIEFKRL